MGLRPDVEFRNLRDSTGFETIFRRATGSQPYPFQVRFAQRLPALVRVPTGLGKTAMAMLGWLWRRRFAEAAIRAATPRRLVYCLPMRALVEQTKSVAIGCVNRLNLAGEVRIHVVMGGTASDEWDLEPERDAIIVGTQDMLLSRALNRGYVVGRARWPIPFGLLNNDCLWVLDEVQLMGAGLATTAQLHAFRGRMGVVGTVGSVWMSATLEPRWVHTVDLSLEDTDQLLEVDAADLAAPAIKRRYEATKILQRARSSSGDARALADEILAHHRPGSLTLAIVNTVERARTVYERLRRRAGKVSVALIHSRFRPPEREAKVRELLAPPADPGLIVVTTQVVEAGVDVSARVLFTELAPWASLVQRFGRCNRGGEFSREDPARVMWVDVDTTNPKAVLPYRGGDLDRAREVLKSLDGGTVGPVQLAKLDVRLPHEPTYVLRRKDLLELFDTTPDISGSDLDVDRFVRDTDETDVRVFWRALEGKAPAPELPLPARDELCPAPLAGFRHFVERLREKGLRVYRRNFLDGTWDGVADPRALYPGQVYLLDSRAGGYDPDVGWTGAVGGHAVQALAPATATDPDAADERDPLSQIAVWQTIAEHTDDVCEELETILSSVAVPAAGALRAAARWHDWGKAHPVFQQALPEGAPRAGEYWAKARGRWKRYGRRHFRHELASALAVLQLSDPQGSLDARDLVAYLIAAHHGRVRLSIRSVPGESPPKGGGRFARGVWDGDILPSTDLGGGVIAPSVPLSLGPMDVGSSADGAPSWGERTLRLRDTLGPFVLGYLEALLRAADARASARAGIGAALASGAP